MINNYTLNELLAVNLSREFKNGEVGFTGLATGKKATLYITAIPLVAMELAKERMLPILILFLLDGFKILIYPKLINCQKPNMTKHFAIFHVKLNILHTLISIVIKEILVLPLVQEFK